jgi:Tetracyclin repressor-like, C-terminal domain/Cytochrome P450
MSGVEMGELGKDEDGIILFEPLHDVLLNACLAVEMRVLPAMNPTMKTPAKPHGKYYLPDQTLTFRNDTPVPDTGSTEEDLLRVMWALLRMYNDPATGPLLSGLVAAMARNDVIAQAVRGGMVASWREAVRQVLARGVARGDLRRDIDIELTIDLLSGPLFLTPLVRERRQIASDDLLTRLVVAEVEGERLLEDEILAFFELLLLAGHETATNLIANAVPALLAHPQEMERLRSSPQLLVLAVEEVLRYRLPVQAMFRVTRREVVIHGQVIPKGKLVVVTKKHRRHKNTFRFLVFLVPLCGYSP